MTLLILGLVMFLGAHAMRIVADGWRTTMVASSARRSGRGCTRWCRSSASC